MDPVKIPLSRGLFALVDAADAEWAQQLRWQAQPSRGGALRAVTMINEGDRWRPRKMHRLLLGVTDPHIQVDHINGDPLDNRRANLRLCTQAQNACNRGKRREDCTSKYIGVSLVPASWEAIVWHQGRRVYVGRFQSELEAARARDAKARELQGEFARLNFPDDVSGN